MSRRVNKASNYVWIKPPWWWMNCNRGKLKRWIWRWKGPRRKVKTPKEGILTNCGLADRKWGGGGEHITVNDRPGRGRGKRKPQKVAGEIKEWQNEGLIDAGGRGMKVKGTGGYVTRKNNENTTSSVTVKTLAWWRLNLCRFKVSENS